MVDTHRHEAIEQRQFMAEIEQEDEKEIPIL